jgi:hypothetical protein
LPCPGGCGNSRPSATGNRIGPPCADWGVMDWFVGGAACAGSLSRRQWSPAGHVQHAEPGGAAELLHYPQGLVGDDAEDVASEAWLPIVAGTRPRPSARERKAHGRVPHGRDRLITST